MSDLDLASRKLFRAVAEFAKHGTLQARLMAAYQRASDLDEATLADRAQREMFLAIQGRMTAGRSVRIMSDDEAQDIADMLVELSGRVKAARYAAQPA